MTQNKEVNVIQILLPRSVRVSFYGTFFLTDKDVCERKMNCAEKTGRKLWGK